MSLWSRRAIFGTDFCAVAVRDQTAPCQSMAKVPLISGDVWVSGVEDGKNKYMCPVMFAVWNALKKAEIEMPYPQSVVHLKAGPRA